jgi:hypothetical protein
VTHRTDYWYGVPVTSGQTIAHLLVRETPHQHVLLADVEVVPRRTTSTRTSTASATWSRTSRQQPHELSVTSMSDVEVVVRRADRLAAWEETPVLLAGDTRPTGCWPGSARWTRRWSSATTPWLPTPRPSLAAGRPLHDGVADLTRRIFADFAFDPASPTSPRRRWRCSTIAAGVPGLRPPRHRVPAPPRLPARYVSGYIETEPP